MQCVSNVCHSVYNTNALYTNDFSEQMILVRKNPFFSLFLFIIYKMSQYLQSLTLSNIAPF